MRTLALGIAFLSLGIGLVACDAEDKQVASEETDAGAGGTSQGGSSGTATGGTSGGSQGGHAGTGGTGTGGSAGVAQGGSAQGGSAQGGQAGSAQGGSSGEAGSSGQGGNAGQAGSSGQGGGGGSCQPTGTFGTVNTLATGTRITALTLTSDSVFWITYGVPGELMRVPKSGGMAEALASDLMASTNVASDASHIYWIAGTSQQVFRIPIAGGVVETVSTTVAPSTGTAFALSSTTAYLGDDWIYSVPLTGGPTETFFQGHPSRWVLDMATDGTNVVWSSWVDPNQGSGPSKIYSMTASGTPVELDSVDATKLGGVMTDGLDVYYLEYGASVRRVPLTGGGATILANAAAGPASPAMDANYVYFAEGPTDGCWSVHRVTKAAGGSVETIATGLFDGSAGYAQGRNMAVDDGYVYLGLYGGGILQIPKQ